MKIKLEKDKDVQFWHGSQDDLFYKIDGSLNDGTYWGSVFERAQCGHQEWADEPSWNDCFNSFDEAVAFIEKVIREFQT